VLVIALQEVAPVARYTGRTCRLSLERMLLQWVVEVRAPGMECLLVVETVETRPSLYGPRMVEEVEAISEMDKMEAVVEEAMRI